MQKDANLVELEKCCQTHIFLQNFVLIQPRTSPPKICKIFEKCIFEKCIFEKSAPPGGAVIQAGTMLSASPSADVVCSSSTSAETELSSWLPRAADADPIYAASTMSCRLTTQYYSAEHKICKQVPLNRGNISHTIRPLQSQRTIRPLLPAMRPD